MTTGALTPFDRDTALEPLGDDRWRAGVKESWFVVNGPNDMRAVEGGFGSGTGRVAGWMRPRDVRPLDAPLLAALTDAWLPAAFARLRERVIVPTVDLAIHWRAPLDGLGEHPWVLGVFSTRTGAGGVWEEDGDLWNEGGVLLAQSRQLAIVRRPR